MAFQGVMLQVYEVLIGWTYVILSILLLAKIWQMFNLTGNIGNLWNWATGQTTPAAGTPEAAAEAAARARGGAGAPDQVQNFRGRMVP